MEDARMARHKLTDEQWECIECFFKKRARTGRPPANRREVMNAILWIVRTGAPWRDLPEEFGPWQTVYHHFNQWSSNGKLNKILSHLKQAMSDSESFDHELWCIDGTVVRAARCAAGGGKKAIRKSLTTTH
jgi:transposase